LLAVQIYRFLWKKQNCTPGKGLREGANEEYYIIFVLLSTEPQAPFHYFCGVKKVGNKIPPQE
jgi:hypothetical protein